MKLNNLLYNNGINKRAAEEEESEDGFISPADISIKDEKIWDPTDEEILSYALKLGYDIEKDPDELFEIAYYYMKYPLPEGWKRGIMKSTKELVYINFINGEIEVSTEIEEMAHQMYLEKKSEMNQNKISIFKKSPEKKETTTVVPRKKIPPLNSLQKSNNTLGAKNLPSIKYANPKTNKINKNENLQFNDDKKKLNKNNNILDTYKSDNNKNVKVNNNIEQFLEKSLNEEDFKDLYNNKDKNENNIIHNEKKNINLEEKNKNFELLLNLGGNDDEEEEDEEIEEDEENLVTKNDKEEKEDSFLQQMLKREREIEELRKQKENDIQNFLNKNENLKNIVNLNNINQQKDDIEKKSEYKSESCENLKNIELFKEKKEYLKKKLRELQEYKEEIKTIYQDKKEEFEKYKKEKEIFFINKLKEEINNNKKKLEKQYKEKLELYEKQLINKKSKEEKKYKDELIKNIKSKTNENKEIKKKREEKQKEELNKKKLELLKEIEYLKSMKIKNESKLSQIKMKIQNHLLLIEEKKNIEKNNKTRKNELEIKNIENQIEKEFQQTKINLSKNLTSIVFTPLIINNIDDEGVKSNYSNEMKKLLNDEYDFNCKIFVQELENKKLKEIDKYLILMTEEKKEKINYFKNEIISIEKDYYKSISNIRNNFQKDKFNNENNLKLKFEQTLNDYEQTKNLILKQNQQLMQYINDNLHKLMIGNYSLKQTENKLDEILLNLKDTYLLVYQKNKNSFEMYENDYIFKTQFIEYLLDIINYMTKSFNYIKNKSIEKNNNNEENIKLNENNERDIVENLLIFCNEKLIEYKKKYKNVKNSSLFHFMNGNLMKSQSFDGSIINEFDDINKTILFDIPSRRKNSKDNVIEKNTKNKINLNSDNENEKINLKNENNKENNPKLTYFIIDQKNNFKIPIIPENILSNLNEDILILYSDIALFLKNEYNKIQQINELIKENNNKDNISININLIILEKIKAFSEESFIYLLNNYKNSEKQLNIKKKFRLILSHIEEYKNNLNLDKYLKNISNKDLKEENDIVNQMQIDNTNIIQDRLSINNYINNKEDNFYKNNIISKKYPSINQPIKEKEEQKQSCYDINLSNSFKGKYNGRFNDFYSQYNFNTLVNTINNPLLYQFFNYKKNKYELDKTLGKFTMP